jgi:aminopeptidase
VRSREARNVFTRLAELSVHGANVQKGQIVLVQAEIGLEEQARATAEAAYKRGAKFVDVAYFDPYLKRVRIESADPDTLDFVPQWYGERVLEHAEQNGARISMRGVTAPHVMDGLDKSLLGKDMLPSVKETFKVVSDRSTNWCFVPAPLRRGRRSSIPICRRTRRISNSGASLSTCCASTSPTRSPPGTSAWRC